jgi:glycosyltransferase involved in cell wall biosynthesis
MFHGRDWLIPNIRYSQGVGRMKVLHVIAATEMGGAETMLARLLDSSPVDRKQAAVVSLMPPGYAGERIREQGVQLFTLRSRGGLGSPMAVLKLARIVNYFAPDILHGWTYHGNLAASLASGMLAKPVSLIWNVRQSLTNSRKNSWRDRALLRLTAAMSRKPDAIIYNSLAASLQHQQRGYAAGNSLHIPNGVDSSLFSPNPQARAYLCKLFDIEPRAFVIGHIAGVHPRKDHRMLVEAASRALAQGLNVHLLLVGNGVDALPSAVREYIAGNLPPDRVTLSGSRTDVASWLPGLDVLAMSSAWGEGFSNVIAEALACGVPVVATDVGDSATVIGDCGIVVPPQTAQAFADALVSIGTMPPDERHAMGLAGRERVRELYSIDQISKRYNELHRKLVADTRHLGIPSLRPRTPAGNVQP